MQTEKQRERLVELIKNADSYENLRSYDLYDLVHDTGGAEEFADYLIANNVVVLPCKVGQVLWFPSEYYNEPYSVFITKAEIYEEETIMYSEGGTEWYDEDIGKIVFLSRAEAENVLKERKENGK